MKYFLIFTTFAIMSPIDQIFSISSPATFQAAALTTFARQAVDCLPYRDYLKLMGITPESIKSATQIPFLPIELFKSHNVYCGSTPPEAIFTSSSTTGTTPASHPMQSLALYERAFLGCFRQFYGDPAKWSLYALLPNYLSRKGSSLVYMADRLIAQCGSGGFYLDQYQDLIQAIEADPKPKILLGVSYALWDLAEKFAPKLQNTIVMETGGMKGNREELPKVEFYNILCNAFGVKQIHSEYGMAELTSQAYSSGNNRFHCPAWMHVNVREINDPFTILPNNQRGGLNITDLSNYYSCSFIQTQDIGSTFADQGFEVTGRIDHSEIRGCNLLVQ